MESSGLDLESQEALVSTKMNALRKKINADSWSDNIEGLMKDWGEKAAGLRYMHGISGGGWKALSNKLTIYGIVVTTVASTMSLVTANIDDENTQTALMYTAGGIGLVSSLIQSFKKFYDADEKAADHNSISKQFGSYYRYMTLQLGMSREDRDPADVLSAWALKEFERLQMEAPPLSGNSVTLFKDKFKNSTQAVPDVDEDEFIIYVHGTKNVVKEENIELTVQ